MVNAMHKELEALLVWMQANRNLNDVSGGELGEWADKLGALLREGGDYVEVPRKPTREMLNAAIDVDSFKLGDISPLGFRCSPQRLFERCYTAMLDAALTGDSR